MWGICLKLVERVFGRQKSEPSVFGDKGFRGFPGNQTVLLITMLGPWGFVIKQLECKFL